MNTKRRGAWVLWAGLGMVLLSGCQTWVPETGQTLPSGYYLKQAPGYFPPSPAFPLPREESGLEQYYSRTAADPGVPVAR